MRYSTIIGLCLAFVASNAAAQSSQPVALATGADVDALCDASLSVESAFPNLCDGALAAVREEVALEVSPVEERVDAVRVIEAPPTHLPPDAMAPEPEAAEEDPVLAALRARDYARARARALFHTYEVTVPADAFPAWTYDDQTATLRAVVGHDVPLFGGAYVLHLDDQSGLEFPMEEAHADTLLASRAMGSLSVRLRFTLVARESPWESICQVQGDTPRIDARLVAAELEESWSEEPAARALTVAYEEERVLEAAERSGVVTPVAEPRVEVTSMELEGAEGCTSRDAAVLSASVEGVLTECYVTGLGRNASLRGALVLSFDLTANGHAQSPRVQIDALDDEFVRDCAMAALDRLTMVRDDDADPLEIRASVRFTPGE